MRATILSLTCLATACTALTREEDWPEAESFDRGRIAPEPAGESAGKCAPLVPKATYAIDSELAIDLERRDAGSIEPGQWMEFRARIRNAGSDERKVVLSSDGSEVGWREPHVWFTAYVQQPGSECAIEVPKLAMSRCGLYDHDWHDEVVELDVGDERTLEWLGSPSYALDFAAMPAGTVTLFLHYAFTGGEAQKGRTGEATADLGPMKGESAYEVVSNPIVFELEHPLALELTPRKDRKRSPKEVGDLFTINVRNVGKHARMIAAPDSSRLTFEVQGTEPSWPQASFLETPPEPRRLGAGKSMQLMGDDAPTPKPEWSWVHPTKEKVRVRAYFRPYTDAGKESVQIASEWVEIDLSR